MLRQAEMDESDLNISLNLSISPSGSLFGKEKRQKVFGNRAKRIKQRQKIKLEKQNAEPPKQSTSAKLKRKGPPISDDQDDNFPTAKVARKENDSGGTRKMDKEVISSLFRHNPDIPAVKRTDVKKVTEEVFASTKFGDLSLHSHLISNLEEKLGLVTMTRVQQLSIPVILQEKDILIKSQTGSGKTLAYAVPIVHTLASMPRKIQRTNGCYAVVIVPTRELAIQTYETFSKLLQVLTSLGEKIICKDSSRRDMLYKGSEFLLSAVWIVAGCLMGGEKRKAEKARIRKGINIFVSTPGRLLDHLKHTGCLNLNHVRWLVIDEADRMLELGYERDVAEIITTLNTHCVEERQTILLSATLSAGVERLAGMSLKNHENIDASGDANKNAIASAAQCLNNNNDSKHFIFTLPEKLKQHFVLVPCKLRLVTLAAFVLWQCKLQGRKSKMIVFLSTQDSVDFHHQLFSQVFGRTMPSEYAHDGDDQLQGISSGMSPNEGLAFFKLHGDLAQKERTQVFQEFTAASSGVLLCTDVASRGLHLPRVNWIVQYTTPGATVDYIHRVGRTARAGKQGDALLFLMPSEVDYIQELNKHQISLKEMVVKDILSSLLIAIPDMLPSNKETKRQMPRTFEEASTFLQDRFEDSVSRNRNLQSLAMKGYQSFVRAYTTYPGHLKNIFSMKDLHLGHVAKSFALRKSPANLQSASSRGKGRVMSVNPRLNFESKEKKLSNKGQKKYPLSATVSEFGSGLESNKNSMTRKLKRKKR